MSNNDSLKKELFALGKELTSAFQQMKQSKEFKSLEKDLVKGAKVISSSLKKSLEAAQKSPATAKIKKRLTRVAKVGTAEGKTQAKKAQRVAAINIRKATKSLRELVKNLKAKK
jgi:hypothetical protein